jgi:putative oxidoreductase
MLNKLLATSNEWQLTVMRLAVGIMILPHGMQKTFGTFGGPGFSAQMAGFTGPGHIPAVFAFLAIMAELLGGIGLILGCLTRIASFGVLCVMVIGAALVNLPNGLFMNWTGQQKGEGFEFHILAVALLIALMTKGAGPLSIDRAFSRK